MKKLFILFGLLFFCCFSNAATYRYSMSFVNCSPTISQKSCTALRSALDACAPVPWVSTGCSAEQPIIGTKINWVNPSTSATTTWSVVGLSINCEFGEHLDAVTQLCVSNDTVNIQACLPSSRTIAPCPSGFAPANAIPSSTAQPDPYLSNYDTMPVQDILYAIGVALFGVLGIGIGVKLS